MLKPTLVSMIALSFALLVVACEPAEEPPPTDEQEAVEDTFAFGPDSVVEAIGRNWIVRARSGRACVAVPHSAIPEGQEIKVEIKGISPSTAVEPPPLSPGFRKARNDGLRVHPPIYGFRVTDAGGAPAQFADSVVFAICVNHQPGELEDLALARDLGTADSLIEYLPVVPVPASCRLTCPASSEPGQTTVWLERLFEGSPVTPATAEAAVEQTGLGGKGRGTSPFAAVERPGGSAP